MNTQPDALTQRYGPPARFAEHTLGDLILYADEMGEVTQGCVCYIYVTENKPYTPHYLVIPNLALDDVVELVFPREIVHHPADTHGYD